MKSAIQCVLIFTTLLLAILAHSQEKSQPNLRSLTIYGEDNRQDLFEILDPRWREISRSVGALILSQKIVLQKEGDYLLDLKSYGRRFKLCPDVRYFEQPSAPFATAFLVAPNLVMTAAHAVVNSSSEAIVGEYPCAKVKIIFDYALSSSETDLNRQPADSVYSCKRVVERKLTMLNDDYELIELDRPVNKRTLLKFAQQEMPSVGTPIMVLGYPHGIPLKFASNAKIREINGQRFSSNSDTLAGNSGSPIFNALTYEVLGIHVSGDYDLKGEACKKPFLCADGDCWGSWGYRPPRDTLERFKLIHK